MTYVFWHPYLMFHQAAYIRELSLKPGNVVHWCVEEDLPAFYRDRGYPIPEVGNVQVHISPSSRRIRELANISGSVQVFFGIRGFDLPIIAFKESLRSSVYRFLMTENRYEPGIKLFPRWLVYTWDAIRYKKYFSGIFCIGYSGRFGGSRFFKYCSYPSDKIVPFVHLVESRPVKQLVNEAKDKEIIYVGQLIKRKRVDLLLLAFSRLTVSNVQLLIIGKGDQEDNLRALSVKLGIADKVVFINGMPNAEIVNSMAMADVLVLPSRFDGWGAVVNEALMVGTPVICSDRCGASDIINDGINGYVFEAGNVDHLLKCLNRFFCEFKWDRSTLAGNELNRLGGAAVAAYFEKEVGALADSK